MTEKRTVLYESHEKLGAKFVPFAGWEMPVRYSGIVPEHQHVRAQAGIFDVSHMGEIFVTGPEAQRALQYLTCNDVAKLSPGKAQYSALLNDQGGVIDDIIVYCLEHERYLVCVNASNKDKDFSWLTERNTFGNVVIQDESDSYALIALQGPQALEVFKRVSGQDVSQNIPRFGVFTYEFEGREVIVARTGYTGEDGIELFVPVPSALPLWQSLLDQPEVLPIGLGARDSLRLEACYPLHGHELGEDIPALDSGLSWIVKFKKGEFIGREALLAYKDSGVKRKLVPFVLKGKGIAREGVEILNSSEEIVGTVTSGTITPTVNLPVGLCLIEGAYSSNDNEVFANIRGKKIPMELQSGAFYSAIS